MTTSDPGGCGLSFARCFAAEAELSGDNPEFSVYDATQTRTDRTGQIASLNRVGKVQHHSGLRRGWSIPNETSQCFVKLIAGIRDSSEIPASEFQICP